MINPSILGIFIGGLITPKYLKKNKKFKSKIESRLEGAKLKTKNPSIKLEYKPIAELLTAIIIIASVGIGFIGVLWDYAYVQDFMLGSDTLYFRNDGQFVYAIIWIFLTPFLAAGLMSLIVHFIPSWKNYYYASDIERSLVLTGEMKNTKNKENRLKRLQKIAQEYDLSKLSKEATKGFFTVFIVLFLITSPLQYLTLKSHIVFEDRGIIVTPIFKTKGTVYTWSEITSVELDVHETEGADYETHLEPHFDITFTDGRTVNLWDISLPGTKTEDLLMAKDILTEQGIEIEQNMLPNLDNLRKGLQEQIHEVIDDPFGLDSIFEDTPIIKSLIDGTYEAPPIEFPDFEIEPIEIDYDSYFD